MKKSRLQFRKYFLTGLVSILPLWITIIVLWLLFNWTGAVTRPFLGPIFRFFFADTQVAALLLTVSSFFLTLVIVYIVGFLATHIMSRRILEGIENVLTRIPLLKGIYTAARKLTQYVFTVKREYSRVVLVEYPRKGMYSIGLVTADSLLMAGGEGKKFVNVYIATTPNPTSGFLIVVPESDLMPLDMEIEEAMSLIISGGIIQPKDLKPGTVPGQAG